MKSFIQSVLLLIAVVKLTTGAEEVIYAQVGERVTLKSDISKPYVSWLLNDKEVAWRNPFGGSGITDGFWKTNLSISGNDLVIKKMDDRYFATFSCQENHVTDKSKSRQEKTFKLLKLTVNKSPTSLLLPGDSMTLSCIVATRGHKAPKIHWLNPQGEKISSQGVAQVKATHKSSGQWTCVVTNDNKEKRVQIPVRVINLTPGPSHSQYTSKSSGLLVPCSIPSNILWKEIEDAGVQAVHWDFSSPSPDSGLGEEKNSALGPGRPQRLFSLSVGEPVAWKPEQQTDLTPVLDLKKGNLALTRKTGREEDTGDYVCSMEFKNGVTLNVTVHVHLLQITASPATRLSSGQQLNLTCGTGRPLPSDLRLKWLPPNPSRLLPNPNHTRLFIQDVGMEDGGVWRCELWQNNIWLTSAEITLEIENLNVWVLVITCGAAAIVVLLLLILSVGIHRRRQRKMRHPRHRLCNCKNPRPKGFYRT